MASPHQHSPAVGPWPCQPPQRHLVLNLLQQTQRVPVSPAKRGHHSGTAPCRPSWGVTWVVGSLGGEQRLPWLRQGWDAARGIPRGAAAPPAPRPLPATSAGVAQFLGGRG